MNDGRLVVSEHRQDGQTTVNVRSGGDTIVEFGLAATDGDAIDSFTAAAGGLIDLWTTTSSNGLDCALKEMRAYAAISAAGGSVSAVDWVAIDAPVAVADRIARLLLAFMARGSVGVRRNMVQLVPDLRDALVEVGLLVEGAATDQRLMAATEIARGAIDPLDLPETADDTAERIEAHGRRREPVMLGEEVPAVAVLPQEQEGRGNGEELTMGGFGSELVASGVISDRTLMSIDVEPRQCAKIRIRMSGAVSGALTLMHSQRQEDRYLGWAQMVAATGCLPPFPITALAGRPVAVHCIQAWAFLAPAPSPADPAEPFEPTPWGLAELEDPEGTWWLHAVIPEKALVHGFIVDWSASPLNGRTETPEMIVRKMREPVRNGGDRVNRGRLRALRGMARGTVEAFVGEVEGDAAGWQKLLSAIDQMATNLQATEAQLRTSLRSTLDNGAEPAAVMDQAMNVWVSSRILRG